MFAIWFGIPKTCGGTWVNRVEQNREVNDKHDTDSVKEGFQLARVKFDKDGEEGREAPDMEIGSINIWERSEL